MAHENVIKRWPSIVEIDDRNTGILEPPQHRQTQR
jgi:hypothetical protein